MGTNANNATSDDQEFKPYINSIPTKVLSHSIVNHSLTKTRNEAFSISPPNLSIFSVNIDLQYLNTEGNERPHFGMGTMNSVDKDFFNRTLPGGYFLQPIPYNYAMFDPYSGGMIRSPTMTYPYITPPGMMPQQQILYPNNMNQMNVNTSSTPNNSSLDLQNKNFQQKISIIKLESENKALKEKILEMTTNINSLNSDLTNLKNQKVVIKHIEAEPQVIVSKEHENVIKDLKSRVIKYLNKIENKDKDIKEQEQQIKDVEQGYQDKIGKLGRDIENLYKEMQ